MCALEDLKKRVLRGGLISAGEAACLCRVPLASLCAAAAEIREKRCGSGFDLCAIVNAKSGRCSEDCKFCAQSGRCTADISEYPLLSEEAVVAAAHAAEAGGALRFSLVTSGGIVPKGNPDHIESSSAMKFGTYDIDGVQTADSEHYATAHGGYDPTYANSDPNRVLPVDVLREMEKEGVFKKLYRYFSTMVGNGTSIANAKKFGTAIGEQLKKDGVDAVILTST